MVMRHLSYIRVVSLTVLVSITCVTLTLIQEIYRPIEHTDNNDIHSHTEIIAKSLRGDPMNSDSGGFLRKSKTKTIYVVTALGEYKINNVSICRNEKHVDVIVMVHTSPEHFWIRREMRKTWLNSTIYYPKIVKTIFLLGLVDKTSIQHKIEAESQEFGDIIQGYFKDSYRNLTNKGVMGYKWVTEHCMNAEMLIKVDDDSFINFFKYFEDIRMSLIHKKKNIFCNRILPFTMPIIRKRSSKWFVSFDEYRNFSTYPHTYCSGFVVFISTDLIPSLYHAAIASPFFWVDDFFLFGLLPSRVKNVTFETFGSYLTFSYPEGVKCYKQYKGKCRYLVMPAKRREIPIMWKLVTADRQFNSEGQAIWSRTVEATSVISDTFKK